MKKLAFLTLLGLAIVSCKDEKPAKDYLVLSGKIENLKKRNLTLTGYNFEKRIKFDRKTSSFVDTLKIDRDGYYNLIYDKNKVLTLYLSKTDDTGIVFDSKKSDVVNFEGKNAKINAYFIKRAKVYPEVFESPRKLYSLEEADFLDKVDEYKEALTELTIASDLPADFLKREVQNIDSECLRNLSLYQKNYRLLSGDNEYIVSENFPNILDELSFNETDNYMDSFSYSKLISEELQKKAKENNKEGEDYYLTYLETIQTEVTDSLIKNDLLYKRVKNDITYTENLKEYYNKFMGYSTNKTHKDEVSKDYNLLKTVAKGKPAPKFKDFVNYDGGKTSLDDLLGKGKYLYIDVWATWCGFCKREIPLLKRLEQEYHGRNIEFVSISVDKANDLEKWKETIVNREMTGVQLFSGQSHLRLPWAQNFLIKGLPKFILIDPDGNIVSSNAPFPSQGEKLIDMFDDLGI
ncbi:TlpA disulfide reductase family protein [uncultured Tenacibaculum sp.]|uniref:TlpA family protein disulfide reductase n=1 Tax=uncultured Tenacibaculum sp. TaxID=174713 RepID=UPI002631CD9A|nr:TlpA disulfide reductase family protein [uncultured Tenacibaculum sp.]